MKAISVIPVPEYTTVEGGGGLFISILIATVFMLALVKFVPQALKVLEFIAILTSTFYFFLLLLLGVVPDALLEIIALIFGLGFAVMRVLKRNIITQNAAMLASIIGVGAFLGSELGFLPAITLLTALTFYDIIAVFYTKHMVTLAKEVVKQRLAFTVAIPTRKHLFQLGGGDLVMPLVFTVAVLREFGLMVALSTMVGSMLVLVAFFAWLFSRPGKAYPALPPVTLGAMAGFILSLSAKIALGL
jgi:presenilin-like A22 family membrane protease